MSLLGVIARSVGTAARGLENPGTPLTDSGLLSLLGGRPTRSGVTVTQDSALALSAVWRSVNILAGSIASLPLHSYVDDLTTDAPRRIRVPVLDEPHPAWTPFEAVEHAVASLALKGDAFWRLQRRGNGQIATTEPLNPDGVQVYKVPAARDIPESRVYILNGNREDPLTEAEILHIPGFGYDGLRGKSFIRLAREGVGIAQAAEEAAGALYSQGFMGSGFISVDGTPTEASLRRLKAEWRQRTAGLANVHEPAVLPSKAAFHQISINPDDAQFLETRRFQVTEIARWFGIPPHLVGDLERSTSWGTGIEQQAIGFVVWTLRPLLTRMEQRISRWLVRPADPRAYARFKVEGLLRGDSAARAAFYRQLWEIGAASTNEVRAYEELGPVEGGDVRYRPLNMGRLGEFDPPAGQPTPPAPTPPTEE